MIFFSYYIDTYRARLLSRVVVQPRCLLAVGGGRAGHPGRRPLRNLSDPFRPMIMVEIVEALQRDPNPSNGSKGADTIQGSGQGLAFYAPC